MTTGQEDNIPEFYDPETNTIGRMIDPSSAVTYLPTDQQFVASLAGKSGATLNPDATLDGRPAIQITAADKTADPHELTQTTTLWVSPGDDRPLEWINSLTSKSSSGQTTTQSSTIRWENYRSLTGSAASPSLVSLGRASLREHCRAHPHGVERRIFQTLQMIP